MTERQLAAIEAAAHRRRPEVVPVDWVMDMKKLYAKTPQGCGVTLKRRARVPSCGLPG